MDDVAVSFVAGIEYCFADINDPRVQASCEHQLLDILAITERWKRTDHLPEVRTTACSSGQPKVYSN